MTPKHLPTEDIIVATELACKNLNKQSSADLKSEVARSVKKQNRSTSRSKPNITREETKALHALKKDDSILILPADKGKATVVLDKQVYHDKLQTLLNDSHTYEVLKKDPTTTYKNKLINLLKDWEKNDKIPKPLYYNLYPTSEEPPKMYGLPKIHKQDTPLRPIVSSVGSITQNAAKHLAPVLNSVKGKTPHAIKNSADFVNKIQDLEVPPGRTMVSFDVTALFTSIPVHYALQTIRRKLEADDSWKQHTALGLTEVMALLEFCLNTTYFLCNGTFYKQKFGAPMGSSISPGVADLTMEDFEMKALSTCPKHLKPHVWYRYVDDTFTVLHEYSIEGFSNHLNSINPHIKFTSEIEKDGSLPFLDTCVHLQDDGSLKTSVYRKPTHTDQYLNFESNHHLEHKRSVVRSLLDRANTLVSDPIDRAKEVTHVKKVLTANGYKKWTFNLPPKKNREPPPVQSAPPPRKTPPVGLPYVNGLSEELQRVFRNHGVQTFHKPYNTLRSQLVRPKDKADPLKQCGTVYHITCDDCSDDYVGESARALNKRLKEHTDGKHFSAVSEHTAATGHNITPSNTKIIARASGFHPRKIHEALEIHKRRPSLNRDQGTEVAPVLLQLLTPLPPSQVTNNNIALVNTSRPVTRVKVRLRANSLSQ